MHLAPGIFYGLACGLTLTTLNPLGLGAVLGPLTGFLVAFFIVSSTRDIQCGPRDPTSKR